MQFIFSIATGAIWSLVALLEITQAFSEPFPFSPLRTAMLAAFGIAGILAATMHYAWQLWFARATAGILMVFLAASYWFTLLPQNQLKFPYLAGLILWLIVAALAGYQKPTSSIKKL